MKIALNILVDTNQSRSWIKIFFCENTIEIILGEMPNRCVQRNLYVFKRGVSDR